MGLAIKQIMKDIYCFPKRFILYLLIPYSFIWTIIEPAIYFIPRMELAGFNKFLLILAISLIIAFAKMKRSKHVKITIPNSNTKIEIQFGNIFSLEDCKVIPVNEYFDSKLGDHVSENSVHGIFIHKILGRHEELFDDLVKKELEEAKFELVKRNSGKNRKYPLGTTIKVQTHNSTFLLLASSKTDTVTLKANAEVADLMLALQGLWIKARHYCNGRIISIPLIGGGLSNVNLTSIMLLRLIIISIITETKKSKITETIRIVLHEKYIEEINLDAIKEEFGR